MLVQTKLHLLYIGIHCEPDLRHFHRQVLEVLLVALQEPLFELIPILSLQRHIASIHHIDRCTNLLPLLVPLLLDILFVKTEGELCRAVRTHCFTTYRSTCAFNICNTRSTCALNICNT